VAVREASGELVEGESMSEALREAAEELERIARELGDPERLAWEHRHLPGVARAAARRAREAAGEERA
jgi:hypothetical protein